MDAHVNTYELWLIKKLPAKILPFMASMGWDTLRHFADWCAQGPGHTLNFSEEGLFE